jgi:transcriptional regulator GlxA family with amidase domain
MPKTPRFPPCSISRTPRNSARVIEVLAYPSVQLLDVTGPLQVFATANEQIVEAGGRPPYALRVVAKDRARVTASSGLEIATEPLPRAGGGLDTWWSREALALMLPPPIRCCWTGCGSA